MQLGVRVPQRFHGQVQRLCDSETAPVCRGAVCWYRRIWPQGWPGTTSGVADVSPPHGTSRPAGDAIRAAGLHAASGQGRSSSAFGERRFRRPDRRDPHDSRLGDHGHAGDAGVTSRRGCTRARCHPDRRRRAWRAGGPAQHLSGRRRPGAGRASRHHRRDGNLACGLAARQPAGGTRHPAHPREPEHCRHGGGRGVLWARRSSASFRTP